MQNNSPGPAPGENLLLRHGLACDTDSDSERELVVQTEIDK